MPKSGIMRAQTYRRYRESLSHITPAHVSEISSRGIALTDADLAMVIGGTEERSDARAQVEDSPAQLPGCCDGMQTELTVPLYGRRIFY